MHAGPENPAVGTIESPEKLKQLVKIRQVIEPDMGKHREYAKYREIYRELYDRNRELMHKL